MSAHDPYAPGVRHARRVTVPAPPDPTDEVPGHEDEAIHWLLDAIGLDTDATNGPDEWAELVRRTDLVELAEFGRPGHMRPRIIAVVQAARAAHGATEPGQLGQETGEAAVAVLAAIPDSIDGNPGPVDGTEPVPENDAEGNATAQEAQDKADGVVPEKAAEVVAWIQAAPNTENAGRRAQRAWEAEVDRTGGIRATVQAEIDKHLEP